MSTVFIQIDEVCPEALLTVALPSCNWLMPGVEGGRYRRGLEGWTLSPSRF